MCANDNTYRCLDGRQPKSPDVRTDIHSLRENEMSDVRKSLIDLRDLEVDYMDSSNWNQCVFAADTLPYM